MKFIETDNFDIKNFTLINNIINIQSIFSNNKKENTLNPNFYLTYLLLTNNTFIFSDSG